MWKKLMVSLFFSACTFTFYSQSQFNLTNEHSEKIKFKLIDNLMVIPVEINGVELSFLLDSGVSKPILFNIVNLADSLKIYEVETMYLRGLGGGESVEALKSSKNLMRIGNAINVNQDLFVILDETINFTPRLGVPIHGIIGYDILKDFVVEINYSNKYLRFYYHDYYRYKKCKKCETLNLSFFNNKPYLDAEVNIRGNNIPVKLLIDSGGSDALWIFEDKEKGLYLEDEPFFDDFLGLGLSGNVYGHRSKVEAFNLKSFKLKDVNVAFPDSTSIRHARQYEERNGSIGGEILKRFNLIMDYKGAKLTIKKNGLFKSPFNYNKSGLTLQQDGIRIVKEKNISNLFPSNFGRSEEATGSIGIELYKTYRFAVRPAFAIVEIRPDSPAANAGLKVGDIIVTVNNSETNDLSLQEIISFFYGRDGKPVSLRVDRNGLLMNFRFKLQDVFKKKDPQQ